jgi:DNA-directed RNA polymerase subunit RPC12/RpoP
METDKVDNKVRCDNCNNDAKIIINMKFLTIYVCEDCWSELKNLWAFI